MTSVIFTQAAREEVIAAQDWYEREAAGLGGRFLQALVPVTERIGENPRQFPIIFKNTRRAVLRRFPYSLLFVLEEDDTAVVIACFHASRDPAHWQKRV